MKKTYYILLALALASCMKENENLFDASSADRLTAALNESTEILVGAPNGWLVHYYAGVGDEKVGGVSHIFEFGADGWVGITSELAHDSTYRSLYRVLPEQGAVLTFDTYNPVFHYFSEPQGFDKIHGEQGDYEFLISEISADEVILKGKRYGNRVVMRPFISNKTKEQYLSEVRALENVLDAYSDLEVYKDNQKIGSGYYLGVHEAYHIKYAVAPGDSVEKSFYAAYTPDGITLYQTENIAGVEVSKFRWDVSKHAYIGMGEASNLSIRADASPKYSLYEGTYTCEYVGLNSSWQYVSYMRTVNVRAQTRGKTYILSGLSPDFGYVMEFDRIRKVLVFPPQELIISPLYEVLLVPWLGEDRLNLGITAGGYEAVDDLSGPNLIIRFEPDGTVAGAVGLLVVVIDLDALQLFVWDYDHFYRDMVMTKQ
ncbi:MAG: DUF4302 domain-containing protein [Prevotellaceae bacterium]|jgi:hypothetical protein|nr:DUF4302 domain-containing protein [Prevotellaceae bacterium]